MPFFTAALVGGGLSLAGGLFGADAAKKAGRAQAQAAEHAANLQHEQYLQTREDFTPWREAGVRSLSQLEQRLPELTKRFTMADFELDPGYQFRLSEGEKAIQRAAAARGMSLSPASLQELLRYNQGLSSGAFTDSYNRFTQDQGNIYNRLAGLSGTGQTAAQQLGSLGMQSANNIGNYLTSGAAANAAGTVGAANAITGGLGAGLNFYNQQRLLSALGAPGLGGAPSLVPEMAMGQYDLMNPAYG